MTSVGTPCSPLEAALVGRLIERPPTSARLPVGALTREGVPDTELPEVSQFSTSELGDGPRLRPGHRLPRGPSGVDLPRACPPPGSAHRARPGPAARRGPGRRPPARVRRTATRSLRWATAPAVRSDVMPETPASCRDTPTGRRSRPAATAPTSCSWPSWSTGVEAALRANVAGRALEHAPGSVARAAERRAARSADVIPRNCYPVTVAVWSVCRRDAPLETPRAAARVGTPRVAQKASSPAVTSSMMGTMSS